MVRRSKFIMVAVSLLVLGVGFFLAIQDWGPVPYQILPSRGNIQAIAFSPDSKILALGRRSEVILWDAASRKVVASLKGHTDEVRCVTFSPDGKLLASGSSDSTVRLWELPSGKEAGILKGHTGMVWTVAFSPDGKVLASGAKRRPLLRLWDVAGLTQKTDLKLWVEDGGKQLDLEEYGQGEVRCVAFHPDGKVLGVAKTGAPLLIWDLTTGKGEVFARDYPMDSGYLAFSPDGKYLAGDTSPLTIWEVATRKKVVTCEGQGGDVAFSPDGKWLAATRGQMRLWDSTTGKLRVQLSHRRRKLLQESPFKTVGAMVTGVAFSPDGETLVTGAEDGTIILWSLATVLKDRQ